MCDSIMHLSGGRMWETPPDVRTTLQTATHTLNCSSCKREESLHETEIQVRPQFPKKLENLMMSNVNILYFTMKKIQHVCALCFTTKIKDSWCVFVLLFQVIMLCKAISCCLFWGISAYFALKSHFDENRVLSF